MWPNATVGVTGEKEDTSDFRYTHITVSCLLGLSCVTEFV